MKIKIPNLLPVPFRGTTLYIVDIDNVPFTPMKQIVEGMGLAWQTQHRKLESNKERCHRIVKSDQTKRGIVWRLERIN